VSNWGQGEAQRIQGGVRANWKICKKGNQEGDRASRRKSLQGNQNTRRGCSGGQKGGHGIKFRRKEIKISSLHGGRERLDKRKRVAYATRRLNDYS